MSIDFTSQRLSYEQGELIESHLPEQPFSLLQTWVQQAIDAKQGEAYAFSLVLVAVIGSQVCALY